MPGVVPGVGLLPGAVLLPTRRSITYLLADGDAVVHIPRLVDIEEHLD